MEKVVTYEARVTSLAVSVVASDGQLSRLTKRELRHTLIPPYDSHEMM